MVEVTWEIEDGYAGGSRPQFTQVDDDELKEKETEEEKKEFIEECVNGDFKQMSYSITDYGLEDLE